VPVEQARGGDEANGMGGFITINFHDNTRLMPRLQV
jgi:hypothetical protein